MLQSLGHSQQVILQSLLLAEEPMTIESLGDNISISKNAIYQHIGSLERAGLIIKSTLNRTGGRPSQSYALSKSGRNLFPKHYAMFSSSLISILKNDLGPEQVEKYFKKLGDRLGEKYLDQISFMPLAERIKTIGKIMDDIGYETQDDKNASGGKPVIKAHNCVFHDLAQTHNDICKMDIAFMEKLLDADIKHTKSIAKGNACCHFQISARSENGS